MTDANPQPVVLRQDQGHIARLTLNSPSNYNALSLAMIDVDHFKLYNDSYGHLEGDSCLTGFAVRKNEFALYLVAAGPEHDALLAALGRHKMSKACLYIKRLEDVKLDVLEKLIRGSISEVRRRYG